VSNALALDSAMVKARRELILQDGKLTARIVDVPLRQIMEEVSQLTGIHVLWMNAGGEEVVSAEFMVLPLAQAVRQFLVGQNFMFFYVFAEGEERLTQIWISSRERTKEQPILPSSSISEQQVIPQVEEELPTGITQPLEVLLHMAMDSDNSLSRLNAIESLGRYVHDARVKMVLSQLAHDEQNPQVQEVAASVLNGME
jgi:hypothetical protein